MKAEMEGMSHVKDNCGYKAGRYRRVETLC